jgi:predicted acyltransferase
LGILQRLSICYAALLLVHLATDYGSKFGRRLAGLFMIAFYFAYLALMITFGGADRLGPDCTKDNNLTDRCNFAGFVDHLILTDNHCWRGGYTDPEGIVSTMGAILTTYMGCEYSLIMGRYKHQPKQLVLRWLGVSLVFGALVYPMTLLMPLNKKLYSSSFILIVVAISGACLTFFYCVVDLLPAAVTGARKVVEVVTAPLKWLGLNPLAIFVLMDLMAIVCIFYIKIDGVSLWTEFFRHAFKSWIDDEQVAATVFACFFLLLWIVVAGVMHRFKLYVRL